MSNTITIVITDIADGTTEYTITRDQRHGFKIDNNMPGGHDSFSCQIPCALGTQWMHEFGKWPSLGSRVEIWDNDGIFWLGRWNKPHINVKKRVIQTINIGGQGYMHSMKDNSFATRVVYGLGLTGVQIGDDKRNITDIRDGVEGAVGSLCPFITIAGGDPLGINISQDTQSFAGSDAQTVVNFFAGLTSYLSTPFVWWVMVGPGALPTFYFDAITVNPYYFDDGQMTEWDVEYDLEQIINIATVEHGNNERVSSPTDVASIAGPLAYALGGGTNIVRRKYVNAAEQFNSVFDVSALANGYVERFNKLLGGGNIVIHNGPIPTQGLTTTELHRIMPGKAINMRLPNDFPVDDDVDKYIIHTSWDEDACTTTCTVGDPQSLAGEIQRLAAQPEGTKFLYAMSYGDVVNPIRLDVAPPVGTEYAGTSYTDDGGHVVVRTVQPMAAMTTSGGDDSNNQDFGDLGGQLLPGILPDNFSELLIPIRTIDGSAIPVDHSNPIIVIPITKDYKLSTWLTASVQAGHFEVDFKVSTDGTTWSNFLVGVVKQLSGHTATGTYAEKTLSAGDILAVYVVDNTGNIANGSVNLSGNKHWPKFPTYNPHP